MDNQISYFLLFLLRIECSFHYLKTQFTLYMAGVIYIEILHSPALKYELLKPVNYY